ncbi:uncharacterized protein METZ01_LOCUS172778 [marine metagenome]|uniref:Carboxymuconolactone decarboxylase-like domain-containing protein n=1 Tax=marine metagenome TaxID=408172 RepID=A0A382C218_9ZZZZ
MALVKPLAANADKKVAQLAEFFNETLGFCPNSVLTMQRRPAIAQAFINLNKAVMDNQGRVTSELKRLIGYVSSHAAGCQYCQAHTIRAAQRYGGSDARLEAVWEFCSSPLYTDAERAALEFAIAASSIPNAVDDEIASNLHKHWDDGEIVEILGVTALFGYLNRWNDSMATTLEDRAAADGDRYLARQGWSRGKHV